MRILVLIHEYPPLVAVGGRVAQDLCLGLAKTRLRAHGADCPLRRAPFDANGRRGADHPLEVPAARTLQSQFSGDGRLPASRMVLRGKTDTRMEA